MSNKITTTKCECGKLIKSTTWLVLHYVVVQVIQCSIITHYTVNLLKDTPYKGHCTFDLSVKDKLYGPYRHWKKS